MRGFDSVLKDFFLKQESTPANLKLSFVTENPI